MIAFIKASDDLAVKKKKGAYSIPSNLYAGCEFEISLLPVMLNLPMVCILIGPARVKKALEPCQIYLVDILVIQQAKCIIVTLSSSNIKFFNIVISPDWFSETV